MNFKKILLTAYVLGSAQSFYASDTQKSPINNEVASVSHTTRDSNSPVLSNHSLTPADEVDRPESPAVLDEITDLTYLRNIVQHYKSQRSQVLSDKDQMATRLDDLTVKHEEALTELTTTKQLFRQMLELQRSTEHKRNITKLIRQIRKQLVLQKLQNNDDILNEQIKALQQSNTTTKRITYGAITAATAYLFRQQICDNACKGIVWCCNALLERLPANPPSKK